MLRFEAGKTYTTTSAFDHNCMFEITVLSRTDKTLTFKYNGVIRKSKIFTDSDGEYVRPDNYSMAPVFRACRVKPAASAVPSARQEWEGV